MAEIFRSAFTEEKLINSDTVSVVAGQPMRLGTYKVEAGEIITVGYGDLGGQQNAQGRAYADIKSDTNTALEGMLRLSVYSPQDRPLRILGEFHTSTLRAGAGDRTKQSPFPESNNTGVWLSEDKKLVLEFISDTTATVSKANSDILIDMTVEAV